MNALLALLLTLPRTRVRGQEVRSLLLARALGLVQMRQGGVCDLTTLGIFATVNTIAQRANPGICERPTVHLPAAEPVELTG